MIFIKMYVILILNNETDTVDYNNKIIIVNRKQWSNTFIS